MGDNPLLRQAMTDLSISVDGNYRFEWLDYEQFVSAQQQSYNNYIYNINLEHALTVCCIRHMPNIYRCVCILSAFSTKAFARRQPSM